MNSGKSATKSGLVRRYLTVLDLKTSCRALSAGVRWSKTICRGSCVPQPKRNCHESHVSKHLVHNMAEIEGEISMEIEIWTPVKEDKLVAAWQCHECLFNITSCNYSNRGMKEKALQEMSGKQNKNVCVFFIVSVYLQSFFTLNLKCDFRCPLKTSTLLA